MDDLIKDLYNWSKELEAREHEGLCRMQPQELFTLSVLLECAAQRICELRTARDMALAKARAASYGR